RLRRSRSHPVLPDVVADISVDALIQLLNKRTRKQKLRRPDLLHTRAQIREIDHSPELRHFPDREFTLRRQILSEIRRNAFSLNGEALDLLNARYSSERFRGLADDLHLRRNAVARR